MTPDATAMTPAREAVRLIGDIILLCRMGGDGDAYAAVSEKYGRRLQEIAKQIMALRKAIGEDIVACEFVPTVEPSAQTFRSDYMEDSFAKDTRSATKDKRERMRVLCTTELGLTRFEKSDKDGATHSTLLSKPRVVLESLLEELELEGRWADEVEM